ncbi:MAG TPA: KamA family radical SAM protein [Bacteroidales bacterium]|nr:KamA family radical SAM protein [Bacteroidales bacterium]HSA42457.1 KamA family radical SAM protein [Bacteroidales bacterium]
MKTQIQQALKGAANLQKLVTGLWETDRELFRILRDAGNTAQARENTFTYLNTLERAYFNIYAESKLKTLHILDRNLAKECIRVMKNVIRTENELLSGFSALKTLRRLAGGDTDTLQRISPGFILEFYHLILGIRGEAAIHRLQTELGESGEDRETALLRSDHLDVYSGMIENKASYYRSFWNETRQVLREQFKEKIRKHLGGSVSDWNDPFWQVRHVIRDRKQLESLVTLSEDEQEGLRLAEKHHIDFQITPYYLSLFNPEGRDESDRVVRAQVLPSATYCRNVKLNRETGCDMDFMGEKSTSPVDGITRRYAQILILKPYDSCPQICVYCQRNWEIKGLDEAKTTPARIEKAIRWIADTPAITEVLVTGGDPLTLPNGYLGRIIGKLADIPHIERIRIGTRTPVTMPCRIDDGFLAILEKHHVPGRREMVVITHFQHAFEITPEVTEAVSRIRKLGVGVYNQQVFTYYNSRRFETAFLRKILKINGIDPYYSFNTKGKAETVDFRVPIARIEQERKEEARILPGIVRTDEPVFNVPRLGKSHLRAWQDHEPIMIMPDGSRVYRFYPWESMIARTEDYLYTDISITNYLQRLARDGEDPADYASIWYYF